MLIALELPETPPNIALKMKARPSGTKIPNIRAERSLTLAFKSFSAISNAVLASPRGRMDGGAGTVGSVMSVTERPAGQVQEHRFQVRLGDLDRLDRRPLSGRRGEDGGQVIPGVRHDKADSVLGHACFLN